MIKRKDVVFFDIYAYDKEIPSIAITNEQFYTAFTVGGIVDENFIPCNRSIYKWV